MAYSTSDALETIVREANQHLANFVPTWASWMNLHTDKAAAMRRWSNHGVAALKTWNGTATISEATGAASSSREQTVTPDGFASKVTVSDFDSRFQAGSVERAARGLLEGFERRLEATAYSMLETAFTADQVDSGGSTDYVISATSCYVDADGTGTYETAQSNLLSAALSSATLSTSRQMLLEAKLPNGDPAGKGRGPLVLIVAPQNAAIARKLVESPEQLSADATGNLNPNYGANISVIVSSHLTVDPDDWFLVEAGGGVGSPCNMWIADTPKIWQNTTSAGAIELCASAWLNAWIDTPPTGIIGSNVS